MKIFTSAYQLKKKTRLNSTDNFESESGVLIKIEDENQNWGVADLKPWPLLGDSNLQVEIQNKGPLFKRALELATEDLIARKSNVSLLKDQFVTNNWLLPAEVDSIPASQVNGILKIKAYKEIINFLTPLIPYEVKIRLDFNGTLSDSEFNFFLENLPDALLKKIEYIEDPTSEITKSWESWNQQIPLAVDFAKGDYWAFQKGWSYLILKPARQDPNSLIDRCNQLGKKFTLTSAMDHPVGFAHGLRFAQNFTHLVSGFLTLDLYEPTSFHKYFQVSENKVNFLKQPQDEFGIGMTKEIEKLKWIEI